MQIVKDKVKPIRDGQKRDALRERWWQYAEKRPGLVKEIAECDRVLVISRVTQNITFAFLPGNMVYSERLVIFPNTIYQFFTILQSSVHELWTRFFTTTHEDRLTYFPSQCFETFPFPLDYEIDPSLETIGQTYYDYRADLMVRNNQGLTTTYNRFHDPEEQNPDILKLRHLHDQMDQAVLKAYGWEDINTPCGFALDYLDIDPKDLPTTVQDRITSGDLFFATADDAIAFGSLVSTGKRKLPWRYKWPAATHDDVLARLLELNQQRYLEEKRGHKAASKASAQPSPETPSIPGLELEE